MPGTVLHLLSQRPGRTGSGTTLDALVREAARAGWGQHVVVGVPKDEAPSVGRLPRECVHPLRFGDPPLGFAVPGMSDVMPYRSTRFSMLTPDGIEQYRDAWRDHLRRVVDEVRPSVIHSHHVWLLSALVKDVAPDVPVVVHGHGTGLRQAELCPHLLPMVREGCARNEAFAVLHGEHAARVAELLGVPAGRVHVVGAGYREELFHARERLTPTRPRVLYAGKLSRAKGLDELLDAWERLGARCPTAELHVAGGGDGEESERFRERLSELGPRVRQHGPLPPEKLAALMRRSTVCVLPSYFEGLPLVLVEALACGCRLVATDLPGVRDAIAPQAGPWLERVALPRMASIDRPLDADLPEFAERLAAAIGTALERPSPGAEPPDTDPFTWRAVFRRVERLWTDVTRTAPEPPPT